MSLAAVVLAGWVAASAAMILLWRRALRTGNAAIVDVAWSFGTGILGAAFAAAADGLPERRLVVAAIALAWSLRLGAHLFRRVSSEAEDVRYRKMRQEHGAAFPRFLLLFYLMQAAWVVLFALPMLLAARNPGPFGLADGLAIAVWVLSIAGETVADRQLAAFRLDPSNGGRVCRVGLWAWSRHPNYFFEWLHWWAYVLLGFGGPQGALTLLGPAVMYVFLTRITGIPPTEARLIESRGEAYRDYQRSVNAFFPGPPRGRP